MPALASRSPERRALSAQVQHDSWAKDPHQRTKALALGHIRSLLRRHPGDLRDVVAAVEAANEDGER